MNEHTVWSSRSIACLAGILVSALGLAGCITLLNLAGRVVMGLGGFVAIGGPYEIAQPAPEWVLLVPGAILAGFAFGGLSLAMSSTVGGFSLVSPVWSALFLSLGWQFAVMGLNPPGGAGIAWGWIICALCFIPMGLLPVPGMLKGNDMFGFNAMTPWMNSGQKPYEDLSYKAAYCVCVGVGGLMGTAAGFALFGAVAG